MYSVYSNKEQGRRTEHCCLYVS